MTNPSIVRAWDSLLTLLDAICDQPLHSLLALWVARGEDLLDQAGFVGYKNGDVGNDASDSASSSADSTMPPPCAPSPDAPPPSEWALLALEGLLEHEMPAIQRIFLLRLLREAIDANAPLPLADVEIAADEARRRNANVDGDADADADGNANADAGGNADVVGDGDTSTSDEEDAEEEKGVGPIPGRSGTTSGGGEEKSGPIPGRSGTTSGGGGGTTRNLRRSVVALSSPPVFTSLSGACSAWGSGEAYDSTAAEAKTDSPSPRLTPQLLRLPAWFVLGAGPLPRALASGAVYGTGAAGGAHSSMEAIARAAMNTYLRAPLNASARAARLRLAVGAMDAAMGSKPTLRALLGASIDAASAPPATPLAALGAREVAALRIIVIRVTHTASRLYAGAVAASAARFVLRASLGTPPSDVALLTALVPAAAALSPVGGAPGGTAALADEFYHWLEAGGGGGLLQPDPHPQQKQQ